MPGTPRTRGSTQRLHPDRLAALSRRGPPWHFALRPPRPPLTPFYPGKLAPGARAEDTHASLAPCFLATPRELHSSTLLPFNNRARSSSFCLSLVRVNESRNSHADYRTSFPPNFPLLFSFSLFPRHRRRHFHLSTFTHADGCITLENWRRIASSYGYTLVPRRKASIDGARVIEI